MTNERIPLLSDKPFDFDPSGRLVTSAAVLRSDSEVKILLVRRAAHEKAFANAWELPGGSVEATDVSIYASLKRELLEETGLSLSRVVAQLPDMAFGRGGCFLNYVVEVEDDRTVTVDPNEHSAYLWVAANDIDELQMTDGKRQVIRDVFAFAETFVQLHSQRVLGV